MHSSKTIVGILNYSRAAGEAPNDDHFDVIMDNGRFRVTHLGLPAGRRGAGNRGGGNRDRGGRGGASPIPSRRQNDDDSDGGCCIVM